MRPTLPHPAPDERGFILVGVVTFMLALTILGMSLFALSSYEAQFFVASAAREQSLQNSESGMELVKALLADPGRDLSRLEFAHRAEGQMGVTSAMAYQWRGPLATDTTSTGPVSWSDSLVIVVTAKSGGVERTLQAKFMPGIAENPYQRLLVAGGVSVDSDHPTEPQISGRVWQPVASSADTSWTSDVEWNSGRPVQCGTPPAAAVSAFVDFNLPSATDPSTASGTKLTDHDDYEIDFMGDAANPANPKFFQSPPSSPTDHADSEDNDNIGRYSFYVNDDLDIKVQGVAVWVVGTPGTGGLQGVGFKNRVRVRAYDSNIPSTLVIVAKAGAANRGIWFRGGLRVSDGVQVFVVSDGDVYVVHDNDADKSTDAGAISIVAGGRIVIGGPDSEHSFELDYDAASMDALADQLLARGALPYVTGGAGANFLAMRPSWLETTPR